MTHGHDDFAGEPVPGLPENLPEGEHIVWQGAPSWKALAVEAFHVRKVALYFAVLMAWRVTASLQAGFDSSTAILAALALLPLAAAAVGLLSLAAWMAARAALYTITNRRVAMRIGVALTKTFNIPFRAIDGALLKGGASGTGDIALTLSPDSRIGYAHLWPHARPWFVNHPQPTLRAIPDAARVAGVLRTAMQAQSLRTVPLEAAGAPCAPQPHATAPFPMGGLPA